MKMTQKRQPTFSVGDGDEMKKKTKKKSKKLMFLFIKQEFNIN